MDISFSIKLMSGIIIPIEIHCQDVLLLTLSQLYVEVYNHLVKIDEEMYGKLTRYHIKLFSLNNNDEIGQIDSLYRDIMTSSVVGCYINEIVVYIDNDDNTEYTLIDHNGNLLDTNPYNWINFIVLSNNGVITLSGYESYNKFFSDNDIFNIENDNIKLIDINSICNSVSEYFLSFQHLFNPNNYENIISLVQIEYENHCKGFVQSYEDDMKWHSLLETDNYQYRKSRYILETWENEQDHPQALE